MTLRFPLRWHFDFGSEEAGRCSMGRKHRPSGHKHPLPVDFFVCPQTAPHEESALIQTGLTALTHLVRDSQLENGPIAWKPYYDSDGLQIYLATELGSSENIIFMSVTEVEGTLEEAAALHTADTTEEYRKFSERYSKDLIDCAVLKTLAAPTREHPHNYIGLKWVTLEGPPTIRNRDYCFIECRDEFSINDVNGWARVLHSVDLPWVPDLRESMGIVRAVYENSGIVFKESEKPGFLQIYQLYNTNLRGKVPLWVQRFGIKRRARSLLAYDSYFRAMRLGHVPLLRENELVPASSRRKCFLCQTSFGPFAKRYNCRRCGEVVCRQCNKKWEITDDLQITRFVRICFKCSSGPPRAFFDDSEDGDSSLDGGSRAMSEPNIPHGHYRHSMKQGLNRPQAALDDVDRPRQMMRLSSGPPVQKKKDHRPHIPQRHSVQRTSRSGYDDNTVSREELVGLYRQLKQMKVDGDVAAA
ncbi:unnamed protein product [Aphanomyces euteiches]